VDARTIGITATTIIIVVATDHLITAIHAVALLIRAEIL